MKSSNANIDVGTHELTKHVVLKFLGDDPYVCRQFLNDISVEEPIYPAPEIILEIASYLRSFSQVLFSVIGSLVVAYLFYRKQRRETQKSQEELETKLREILEEHQNQISDHLKVNEELSIKLKKVDLKKIYIRARPDMKTKWELRLKTYSDRANLLKNHAEAAKVIIKILQELTNDKLSQ